MRLHIEDKQKVNGNLQVDCTEYVKDKYQKELKKQKNQKTSFAKITYKQVLSGGVCRISGSPIMAAHQTIEGNSDNFCHFWVTPPRHMLHNIWLNISRGSDYESLCLSCCPEEANRMEVLWDYPPSKAPPAQNVFNFSIFTSNWLCSLLFCCKKTLEKVS